MQLIRNSYVGIPYKQRYIYMNTPLALGSTDAEIYAEINVVGGGISSLKLNGQEYMGGWPASTGGTTSGFVMSPVICSVTKDGKFTHAGQDYTPGKHGITRNLAFDIVAKDNNRVTLRHVFDPAAQPGVYPFRHQIEIEYTVTSDTLTARVTMTNLDTQDMRFAMGMHPAFMWPLPGVESPHSLWLDQPMPDATVTYCPVDGIFQTGKTFENPLAAGQWQPAKADFAGDAYFIRHGEAPVTLHWGDPANPAGHSLIFDMQGWDGIGVWSKTDESPFICIEPFAGIPITDGQATPALEDVHGLRVLKPGQSATATMTIRLG